MRIVPTSAAAALVLMLVLAAVTPAATHGQQGRPVFIALPETFPDVDARVVIVREPGREIVLLNPASATADELGTALQLLPKIRRERGEPVRGQMIPITGFAPGPDLTTEERASLEEAIARLRLRPVAQLGTLGRGRWMPFQGGRS